VKNGSLGTIEAIDQNSMQVRLDGPERKVVVLDYHDYNHLDHGYAATLHKGQGATVDRANVMASKLFDRHTAYVGMTRHVDRVDLHWSREEFRGQDDLYRTLCRKRKKEMAVDYDRAFENNKKSASVIENEKPYPSGLRAVAESLKKIEREMEKASSSDQNLDREARDIEREWSDKNPGTLEELEKELEKMSGEKDPPLSAIEKEIEAMEKLEELDREIQKGDCRDLDHEKDQELGLEEDMEKNQEEQEKDQGMQHELTRGGGGRGFGFGF
jgi:hypothetical protein